MACFLLFNIWCVNKRLYKSKNISLIKNFRLISNWKYQKDYYHLLHTPSPLSRGEYLIFKCIFRFNISLIQFYNLIPLWYCINRRLHICRFESKRKIVSTPRPITCFKMREGFLFIQISIINLSN